MTKFEILFLRLLRVPEAAIVPDFVKGRFPDTKAVLLLEDANGEPGVFGPSAATVVFDGVNGLHDADGRNFERIV